MPSPIEDDEDEDFPDADLTELTCNEEGSLDWEPWTTESSIEYNDFDTRADREGK